MDRGASDGFERGRRQVVRLHIPDSLQRRRYAIVCHRESARLRPSAAHTHMMARARSPLRARLYFGAKGSAKQTAKAAAHRCVRVSRWLQIPPSVDWER